MNDTTQLRTRLRAAEFKTNVIESAVVGYLTRGLTYLAPVVPGILLYGPLMTYMSMSAWQAFLTVIVVELMGLSVVSNWLSVIDYNRQVSNDVRVNQWPYISMVLAYVATVAIVVIGLKVSPDTMRWVAVLMLSSLSLISAIAYVQRQQQSHRVDDIADEAEAKRIQDEITRTQRIERIKMMGDLELQRDRAALQAEIESFKKQYGLQEAPQAPQAIVKLPVPTKTANGSQAPTAPASEDADVTPKLTSAQRRSQIASWLPIDFVDDTPRTQYIDKIVSDYGVSERTAHRDIETVLADRRQVQTNGHR